MKLLKSLKSTVGSERFAPFWVAFSSFVVYWIALAPLRWKNAIFVVPAIWATSALRDDFNAAAKRSVGPKTANAIDSDGAPRRAGGGRFVCRFVRGVFRAFGRAFFGGPYRQYWTAAFLFWLATVRWVSYPHPALVLGWVALAAYLAFYFPAFVAISRSLTRRFRFPVWLAAPVAWTACEWLRNRALGGFSFAGLPHAVYDSLYFIQIAETLGEYGVGAAIVLIGTLIGRGLWELTERKRAVSALSVVGAVAVWAGTTYFGVVRFDDYVGAEIAARNEYREPLRVALLQDGTTYRFPVPADENKRVEETYLALAAEATRGENGEKRPDLIVWPESCAPGFYFDLTEGGFFAQPDESGVDRRDDETRVARSRALLVRERRANFRRTARLDAAALFGTTSFVGNADGTTTVYNSAAFVPYFGGESDVAAASDETILAVPSARYDKRRLVPFGEYIPFAEYLPDWFPMKSACADFSLGRGAGPVVFSVEPREQGDLEKVGDLNEKDETVKIADSRKPCPPLRFAPNVCFESSIPQYVRSQVRELTAAGLAPGALVNVSNDGWFRNGSQTDGHLATQVYRAIENRKTVFSATHGGFSAWVDPTGRVRARGKRGASEVVVGELLPVAFARSTPDFAETFSGVCAILGAFALGLALVEPFWRRRRVRRRSNDDNSAK